LDSSCKKKRQRAARRGRRAICSGLICFAGFQIALALGISYRLPELRDLEYGQRIKFLRAHLREEPNRPLLVVVGGSRTAIGVAPDAIPGSSPDSPLLFNCGLDGADPLLELLCLRRLLADGIRPAWVVIEVMPPLLNLDQGMTELRWGNVRTRLEWRDLPLVWRYSREPWDFHLTWLQEQICPWHTHRRALLKTYARSWLSSELRLGDDRDFRGCFGWRPHPLEPRSPEEAMSFLNLTRIAFTEPLAAFAIQETADRALHEVLSLCRDEQLPVALLLMPESSAFRSWYLPTTHERLDTYLARLSRDYSAPIWDTRSWIGDEGFIDGNHLSVTGAAQFTQLFHRRIIVPLMEGKSPSNVPSGSKQQVARQQ
jgi:hypothetical protein